MKMTPEQNTLSPAETIRGLYLQRKERNKSYSLSAFARDIGISVSILSRMMNGRRPVSLKCGLQICTVLGLDKKAQKTLLDAIVKSSTPTSKISKRLKLELSHNETEKIHAYDTVDVQQFQMMSQWYHLAILNLMRLPDFKADPVAIGKRLGITSQEAHGSLERLLFLGLIRPQGETFKRTSRSFFVQTKNSHLAVRKFHEQMIQKAIVELQDESAESFAQRHISAVTISCSRTQLEAIKDKIEKFQTDILSFLEQSPVSADTVYQLNTQFFPLSKKQKELL